ncbi:VanZ family protein [Skermanella aerolata]|uniref:VanZ family protein n=1 Tax=Skermanella aerolata TaxID=393310 RepID=UPI003D1AB7A4
MTHIDSILLRTPNVLLVRTAAVCAAVVIAFASLSPQGPAIQSGLSDKVDHLAAYTVLMLLMALGWSHRIGLGILLGAAIGFGGLLELLQAFSPGRQPDWADLAVNSCGALIGLAFAFLVFRQRRHGTRAG